MSKKKAELADTQFWIQQVTCKEPQKALLQEGTCNLVDRPGRIRPKLKR